MLWRFRLLFMPLVVLPLIACDMAEQRKDGQLIDPKWCEICAKPTSEQSTEEFFACRALSKRLSSGLWSNEKTSQGFRTGRMDIFSTEVTGVEQPNQVGDPSLSGGSDTYKKSLRDEKEKSIPRFPWPPPTPSDRKSIDRDLVHLSNEAEISVLEVSRRLTKALGDVGYGDHRFYSTPGAGFALITRMERIKVDGHPESETIRFLKPDQEGPFSLSRYLSQLFFAPEGYYRVVVFIVTTEVFVPSENELTAAWADHLSREGLNALPPWYASYRFRPEHNVDAFIYEFHKKPKGTDVDVVPPVRLSATVHLREVGILDALEARIGSLSAR